MTLPPCTTPAAFFAGDAPTVRGDGLVLRPWRAGDAAVVERAYADPAIAFWHMRARGGVSGAGWIAERAGRWSQRTGVEWAVADEVEGAVRGRLGLHYVMPEQGKATVAYWVLPEARGARVAPRALALLCGWAFGERGLHRLELEHSVGNAASCRVAERAGFALEGVKRSELRHEDGWHDMHLHARLAGDPPPASA